MNVTPILNPKLTSLSSDTIPLSWRFFPYWAKQTLRSDIYNYKDAQPKITAQRLGESVFPTLKHPLFIIGSPRSGTTFLGNCLSKLATISYHHEPVATKAAARYVYEARWSLDQAERFYRFVYGWLSRIHLDGNLRFAEKTPRNCLIVPFLRQVFPQAQFIFIARDGRDAALSHSKKPWMQSAMASSGHWEPGGYAFGPTARFWVEPERRAEFEATSDLHRCIWNWRRFNEAAIAGLQGLPPDQLLELRYEQLVHHPSLAGQCIRQFLGLEGQQDGSQDSFLQALNQAQTTSVGLWRQELGQAELELIEQEAGALLKAYVTGEMQVSKHQNLPIPNQTTNDLEPSMI